MICDTSGLFSALVSDQPMHEESLAALNRAPLRVLSPLALYELDHLTSRRHGSGASRRLLAELIEPDYELAGLDQQDLRLALEVMSTYADLNVGLVDASLVVLAKRYNTDEILTLDQRHFRAMRSLSGRPFKLLPLDAD